MAIRTEQDKLNSKVRKLELEIKELERPIWRKPGSVSTIIAALLGLAGLLLQYFHFKADIQDADYRTLRAEIKQDRADRQLTETSDRIKSLNTEELALRNRKRQHEEEIEALRDSHSTMKAESIDLLTKIRGLRAEFSEAKLAQIEKSAASLEAASVNVPIESGSSAPPARVYLHIATEDQRALAKKIGQRLINRGYLVPGIENISAKGNSPTSTELRYYKDSEVDEVKKIIEFLKSTDLVDSIAPEDLSESRWALGNRPRHYELWLSKPK